MRLASGVFYEAIVLAIFYEIIKIGLRKFVFILWSEKIAEVLAKLE